MKEGLVLCNLYCNVYVNLATSQYNNLMKQTKKKSFLAFTHTCYTSPPSNQQGTWYLFNLSGSYLLRQEKRSGVSKLLEP